MTSGEKGENGVFWEQLEKLGPTKRAWNHPKYLNHLHNPQSFKIGFYLCAEGTLTLMTSGENGVSWEQMEELEHTKGDWNCPNFLKHFPKPQYCKIRCYLPAEGTLTLMTSGEKGENGVFWEQLEKLGPTKGAWNHPKYLNDLHNPQSFKINCYLRAGWTLTLMTSGEKGEKG
jgi:hypothetical protein